VKKNLNIESHQSSPKKLMPMNNLCLSHLLALNRKAPRQNAIAKIKIQQVLLDFEHSKECIDFTMMTFLFFFNILE